MCDDEEGYRYCSYCEELILCDPPKECHVCEREFCLDCLAEIFDYVFYCPEHEHIGRKELQAWKEQEAWEKWYYERGRHGI